MSKAPTGIAALDAITRGGLPRGRKRLTEALIGQRRARQSEAR